MAVTWDPAHCDAGLTLSGGNLIATGNSLPVANADFIVRATASVPAASKRYWEIVANGFNGTSNDFGLGYGDSSFTVPQNNYPGFDAHSFGYYCSGDVWSAGTLIGSYNVIVVGVTMMLAVDTVNSKIWVKSSGGGDWNSTPGADPATNVGGIAISQTAPLYPVFVYRDQAVGPFAQATAQFASSSWGFSAPAGFTELTDTITTKGRRTWSDKGTRTGKRQKWAE